jgi:hypothetical protein
MKKLYLLILSGLFVGAAMGQSANPTSTNVKRETKVSASRISTNEVHSDDNRTKFDLPGFPAYLNTGNKDLDDANYDAAKQNWINENRPMFDDYQNEVTRKYMTMPGFPKYVNTGNSVNDIAAYESAKQDWFIEYKASLKQTNSNKK